MADVKPSLLNIEGLVFPEGLVGIPEWKRFNLQQTVDTMPIALLHSNDEPKVSFIVAEPGGWFPSYNFDITDEDMKKIKVEAVEDILVLAIINVENDPFHVTANLISPLLINPDKKLGYQPVLNNSPYLAKQPLTLKTIAVHLEAGLLGLPEYKNFILQIVDELMPVMLLVSKEESRLSFPLVDPFLVEPAYKPKIGAKDKKAIGVKSVKEVSWLVVLNVRNEPVEVTANLMAPIALNPETGNAIQVLLSGSGYPTMYPLRSIEIVTDTLKKK